MTVDQQIRMETIENVTFQYTKGLLEKGLDAETIAKAFKIPVKKVQDIIQKIKDSNQ